MRYLKLALCLVFLSTIAQGTGVTLPASGGGGAGTGDVSGPASSTDNAVTRWNGAGGDTIQNSGVTIDDSNDMTVNDITVSTPSNIYALSHDSFADYVANEHLLPGAIDHGLLLGLADDDHTQYSLLAGRAGGQTIIGSTLTTEGLTLQDNAVDGAWVQFAGQNLQLYLTGTVPNAIPTAGFNADFQLNRTNAAHTIAAGNYNSQWGGGRGGISGGGDYGVTVGGNTLQITSSGDYNIVAGGYNSGVATSGSFNGIFSGNTNGITDSSYSSVLGGSTNALDEVTYSVIAGGAGNYIKDLDNSSTVTHNSLVGGAGNYIQMAVTTTPGTLTHNHIGGGAGNYVSSTAATSATVLTHNGVLSGSGNYINASDSTPTLTNNVIVGGTGNYMTSALAAKNIVNSVIGGGNVNSFNTNASGGVTGGVISGGSANQIRWGVTGGTVSGGYSNFIEEVSNYGTIGGGQSHIISGVSIYSAIAGGDNGTIDNAGSYSFIGGGEDHTIDGSTYSVIVGGDTNYIKDLDLASTVTHNSLVGGAGNYIQMAVTTTPGTLTHNHIGGGAGNYVSSTATTAAATVTHNTVAGGASNWMMTANADPVTHNTIGGGSANEIQTAVGTGSTYNVIAGGNDNLVNGATRCTIGGGYQNIIGGATNPTYGTIPGGIGNNIGSGVDGASLLGTNNYAVHDLVTILGNGGYSSAAGETIIAYKGAFSTGHVNHNIFVFEGATGDAHIGARTAQADRSDTSTLKLHVTAANEQDHFIGHRALSTNTSSTTYTWPVADAVSTAGAHLATTGTGGALEWQVPTYGEIHVHDGSTAQSIPTGATYTQADGFANDGLANNTTPDVAADEIGITQTGVYQVTGSINFTSGTTGVVWFGAAFLDGVEQDQCHINRKTATNDVGSASFTCFIDVTTVPVDIDFRLRHDNGGSVNFTPTYMNLNISRLGGT